MSRRFACAALLSLAFGCFTPGAPAQFANPDLKSGKAVIRKVLILPPTASVTKAGMKGTDSLVAESRIVENALPGIIAEAMRSKSCTIVDGAFTTEALDKNQELKSAVADIQSHFDSLRHHLDDKPKDVRKGRFTMGDEVTNFNLGAAADALVFVRAGGVVHTTGAKVLGAIAGVSENDFIIVNIAVVDSQNGAVLYYGRSATAGNYLEHPDRMKKPIENSFREWKVSK